MLTCGKKIFGSLKKQLLEKKPFLPSVQLFNQHFLNFIGFLASTSRLLSQRNNKLSYFISLFLDSKGLSYKGLDLASKFSLWSQLIPFFNTILQAFKQLQPQFQ